MIVLAAGIWDTGVVQWLRGTGLKIALLIVGAILLSRSCRWFLGRIGDRIDSQSRSPGQLQEERAKYRRSILQVSSWGLSVLIFSALAFVVLSELDFLARGTLVVIGSVAGTAIGFGAKQVVGDVLAGVFIVAESQYGVGDIIRVSDVGETTGVSGAVEQVTLRTTRLRTADGAAVTLPNGEICQVANLSKGYSRILVDVPLAPDQDLQEAEFVIGRVLEQVHRSERWRPVLLDAPKIRGIDTLDVDRVVIQVLAQTLPAKQFEVGREIRRRISVAFYGAGIKLATPIAQPPPTAG